MIAPAAMARDSAAQDMAPMPQCQVREFAMRLRYQQQSAEVRALQLQAYALATANLKAAIVRTDNPTKTGARRP